ncbi:hypothetical protein SAMN05216351_1205 [Pseudobutyrivibrio sp. JW11]|uniref:hypothetical protein n=1 Tax=Pseudobutyrivibrio sp. JW11 TaxID=1855302 RepID=UPI0008EB08D1|nr:hypothetical protein [Pseudobutyrivibrio sp. JW11]SFO62419.1 hypothetical protein SAMN05216351_1205 [Pseudobutyrivibrio sp. JW11]
MKKKLLTAVVSIAILWFSFPTESLAAEENTTSTEITEITDEENSYDSVEDTVNNQTESSVESEDESKTKSEAKDESAEEDTENAEEEVKEEAEETEDEAEEVADKAEDETIETETILETHSENHCTIIVSYTKEVYDDPFARLDTTELSLKSTYELVESQSADEFIQNIENDDIKMILSKVAFDDDFTNGYNISASIDVDNNVTIKSIKKTEKEEVVTEVEVEVTSTNESEPLDEE